MPSDSHLTSPQFTNNDPHGHPDFNPDGSRRPLQEGPGMAKYRGDGNIAVPENEGGPYEQTAQYKYQRQRFMGGPDYWPPDDDYGRGEN